jgi:hypothetical protein
VHVQGNQAGRHVSENVQYVADLWSRSSKGEPAPSLRWGFHAFRAGPGQLSGDLEDSVVVIQQAARGAVPEVHHQQQVRLSLGAAHADAQA